MRFYDGAMIVSLYITFQEHISGLFMHGAMIVQLYILFEKQINNTLVTWRYDYEVVSCIRGTH